MYLTFNMSTKANECIFLYIWRERRKKLALFQGLIFEMLAANTDLLNGRPPVHYARLFA